MGDLSHTERGGIPEGISAFIALCMTEGIPSPPPLAKPRTCRAVTVAFAATTEHGTQHNVDVGSKNGGFVAIIVRR